MPSRHIAFCLYPQHPLFSIACALEVLRHANRRLGEDTYTWSFVSEDDQPVYDSNGLPHGPTQSLDALKTDDFFLVAGLDIDAIESPRVSDWLRSRSSTLSNIGGICNGGFLLARTGLLDDYQATVHWEDFPSFCVLHPRVRARYQRFVIDRDRITCSGGAATLDLFLELVRSDHGHRVVSWIARTMNLQEHPATVDANDHRIFDAGNRYSSRLERALTLLDAGFEEKINVEGLARRVGLSRRELLRLFRKETGRTPTEVINERRLEKTRSLVLHTHLPLITIADSVGFSSQSHMTRCYRDAFGITPARERARRSAGATPLRTGASG